MSINGVSFNGGDEWDMTIPRRKCQKCGENAYFHLCKVKHNIYLFWFLKICSITQGYFMVCDECSEIFKLKKSGYKKLRQEQVEKIKSGDVDPEIARVYFSPAYTGIRWKIFKLVLCILWLTVFAAFAIFEYIIRPLDMGGNVDISGIIFAAIIGLLPICLTLPKFLFALRQHKLHKKYKPEDTKDANEQVEE
ncbi:MAG: hypothetical protein II998_06780 [Clostridia bacterium]|nr:hypothetical protein [Clostridia bacterium]